MGLVKPVSALASITAGRRSRCGLTAPSRAAAPQAEVEVNRMKQPVQNMRDVVRISKHAVESRWRAYQEQFDNVLRTVSNTFSRYMFRRGHQVGLSG